MRGVERPRPGRVLGLDLLDELEPVGRVEGRPEGEQLVEGQAQGIDVGAAVPLAAEPLGGHVAERAQDVAGLGQAVVARLGQAEVGDPDDPFGVQQQVRGLDVAVDDPPRMGVGQARRHLPADVGHAAKERPPARLDRRELRPARQHHRRGRARHGGRGGVARRRGLGLIRIAAIGQGGCGLPVRAGGLGFSRAAGRLRHEPAGQQRLGHPADLPGPGRSGRRRPGRDRRVRPFGLPGRTARMRAILEPPQLVDDQVEPLALDELHGIVADLAVLADLEDRHDVGVVELRRRPRLAAEAGQRLEVLRDLPGQDLQGHAAAEGDLLGLVDHAHAAPADLAEDPVVAHLAQGRQGRPPLPQRRAAPAGPPRPARPRPGPGTARGSRRPGRGSGRCTPASWAARRGGTARRTPRPARRTARNRRNWCSWTWFRSPPSHQASKPGPL